jgi:hypothetical protein
MLWWNLRRPRVPGCSCFLCRRLGQAAPADNYFAYFAALRYSRRADRVAVEVKDRSIGTSDIDVFDLERGIGASPNRSSPSS